jgi:hypothetical protein
MLVGVRLTGLPAGQLSGWATSGWANFLAGPTLSLFRTRPRMRAPAAVLSCIRGLVRRDGVWPSQNFEVQARPASVNSIAAQQRETK